MKKNFAQSNSKDKFAMGQSKGVSSFQMPNKDKDKVQKSSVIENIGKNLSGFQKPAPSPQPKPPKP